MSMQNDPLAEIQASFFIECEELLEALQDGLESIDVDAPDIETINTVFRSVHSIKGGAGAFGLDALVAFAHIYETVLDEVRSQCLEISIEVLRVCFQAADHLSDLVRASRVQDPIPEARSQELLKALAAVLPEQSLDKPDASIEFEPIGVPLSFDFNLDDAETQDEGTEPSVYFAPPPINSSSKKYVMKFTPSAEMFETGNEPGLHLRNIVALGAAEVEIQLDRLPDFADLTPENCYLTWRIKLETTASEDEILSIFEYVNGLSELSVISVDTEKPSPQPSDEIAVPSQPESAAPTISSAKMNSPVETIAQKSPELKVSPPSPKAVVRVDLDRIERLVNLVGELVINQSMLSQSLVQSGVSPHSEAMAGLEEFQRLTRDIQDSVMMIRAQPVKSMFQRMARIVRESSAAIGKSVRLVTTGEGTEVDKTVIERLADPLTHMIRNAVDHGLENSDDRIAAGKSEEGVITLSAAHRSGRVIIEVSDDGDGINRTKVKQIAIDKGLIPQDVELSDVEIDNLLFLPGFSTASVVSDMSGRGVGMDVVRTAIQDLGGRITITSTPGEGTVFSLSLPLTLAVLDGMIIDVAGQTFVLPLNVVIETMTLTHSDIEMVSPCQSVLQLRGGVVPTFDLGHALGYRAPLCVFEEIVAMIISDQDGTHTAFLIDNILDQRQVVIKGFDDGFYRTPGVAAATILGDGKIALILDPSDIITQPPLFPVSPAQSLIAGVSV